MGRRSRRVETVVWKYLSSAQTAPCFTSGRPRQARVGPVGFRMATLKPCPMVLLVLWLADVAVADVTGAGVAFLMMARALRRGGGGADQLADERLSPFIRDAMSHFSFSRFQLENATPAKSRSRQITRHLRIVRKLSKEMLKSRGTTLSPFSRMPAPWFVTSRTPQENTPG